MSIENIEIDKGCIGCGSCEKTCPEVFKLDSSQSFVRETDFNNYKSEISLAESKCPVQVIKVCHKKEHAGNETAYKWPGLFSVVRALHFYSSVIGSVLFAFFAVSGFIANRPHLYSGTTAESIPESIQLSDLDSVEKWVFSTFNKAMQIDAFKHDEENTYVELLLQTPEKMSLEIDNSTREFKRKVSKYFSKDLISLSQVLKFVEEEASMQIAYDSVEQDESIFYMTEESVWADKFLTLDTGLKLYTIEVEQRSFADALINLHRGKHAGNYQRILIDIASLILIIVVLSGMVIGFQNASSRRIIITAVLLTISFSTLISMLISR